MRGNGERIGPQNLPTSSIAGGIWNLLNQQRAQQRGAWPSATPAVVTDPYFMYVPLLLNTTSTNAQQNNTFLDSSTNNFTITRNGTPTQGAFTPYQPSGYWSGYFSGSATTQVSVNPTISAIGTGNFTVEFLYFWTGDSGIDQQIIDLGATGFSIYSLTSSANIAVYDRVANVDIYSTSGYAITKNSWVYIAFVRSGTGAGQTALYINGTSVATAAVASNFSSTSANIGCRYAAVGSNWYPVNGYISNLRISNTARTITVPTAPYSADGNTLFLGLQSNRFINSSGTALTVNGTPKVQAFQPFAPAASYSAATYGGSGWLPGSSSDYLSVADNAAFNFTTGSWTIEAWAYPTARSATYGSTIVSKRNPGAPYTWAWDVSINPSGYPALLSASITSSILAPLNTWTHIAAVSNGSTITLYVNGVVAAGPTAYTVPSTTGSVYIGNYPTDNPFFTGYFSNIRIVKGTAVYTGAFTPPTLAPLTTAGSTSAASYTSTTNVNTSFAASNTSLLTNFTNAGIYDAAWQNNALTVGDAQASTTITAKWPPTSMKFDGTVDALSIPSSTSFGLGTGDWTIEFWLYLNAVSTQTIVSMLTTGTSTAPHIYYASGGGIRYYTNSADRISGSALSTGVWYYIAVTKSSGNTRMYINGTQTGATYPDANNYGTSNPFAVADYAVPLSGASTLNGYVQDVRITKGVARTITTPTAAFPTR